MFIFFYWAAQNDLWVVSLVLAGYNLLLYNNVFFALQFFFVAVAKLVAVH
jgi:hypothetical protein